ncbi:hypothetical protein N7U66_20435 [Lacinutrix neustonica]|uniref:Lipoprotein n=1 Tax=Lacinutrix neustonica TaxID=2980107 RepID=A0A9E8MXJ3_9FLAO|nr:hypothetical protein [Lacinutrix neustonica]WAC02114.1 hypothetical protein N7U66_20435 [Lacinutrix neustonica]
MKKILNVAFVVMLLAVTSCKDTKQEEAETEAAVEQIETIEAETEEIMESVDQNAEELKEELNELDTL